MLRRYLLLFAACHALLVSSAWSAELALGKEAPAIEAKLLDGTQKAQFGAGTGQVTIINFWATWCVPCRTEMPAIQSYYDKYKSQGLQVLAISMDDPRDLTQVRKVAQAFSFPIALKADADFKGFGRIWRMPSTFVVDKNGILRKNGHEGDPTVDEQSLEALVTPLLLGKP
jgi:peroxiredoxin